MFQNSIQIPILELCPDQMSIKMTEKTIIVMHDIYLIEFDQRRPY